LSPGGLRVDGYLHLGAGAVPVALDQDVGGLVVAVDDADGVCGREFEQRSLEDDQGRLGAIGPCLSTSRRETPLTASMTIAASSDVPTYS
jgi:hypothetical protein